MSQYWELAYGVSMCHNIGSSCKWSISVNIEMIDYIYFLELEWLDVYFIFFVNKNKYFIHTFNMIFDFLAKQNTSERPESRLYVTLRKHQICPLC